MHDGQALNDFYIVVYRAEIFLDTDEKVLLKKSLVEMGTSWMHCADIAQGRLGELWFHVPPKAHYAQHFDAEADLINPRFCQNYIDESFISRGAKLWRHALTGPSGPIAQSKVLEKYLMMVDLKTRDDAREE